ncbi:hypothetical protein ALC56_11656 [Trachymyrmex septentrionalis]|uniref:Uncharacterized protein n=1 Tax=Trachymyrmex septentrionalis TaxID=34720 RepID=A0A151JTV5_9HYME|nr:hypothetical protein ALC56_11656 [Trachymyrmex septentrionalis]
MDILAIQQLYGIKNPRLTTITQPSTTEITTNKPEYVDLCTKYDGPHVLQALFPGIPSVPTLAFRYMDGNLHQIAHRPIVGILERRYPLTVTGYKYLNIGINVKLPFYVTIILGDCHGKEIPLSSDIWRELLEQKHVILSLLQYDENNRGIRALEITLRFEQINNLPILRLETNTACLSISKSTVFNIFNLEYCVNHLLLNRNDR